MTPCEHAWADLCEGVPNPITERVIAELGGWERFEGGAPLTYDEFCGAFGSEADSEREQQ